MAGDTAPQLAFEDAVNDSGATQASFLSQACSVVLIYLVQQGTKEFMGVFLSIRLQSGAETFQMCSKPVEAAQSA
jgi:hypothetical protein